MGKEKEKERGGIPMFISHCWCKYVFTIYTYLSLLRLMHLFISHLGVCALLWVVMMTSQGDRTSFKHMLSTT